MPGYQELLLGCGHRRGKQMHPAGAPADWAALTTLDINPDCNPDVEWDLERLPLPFPDATFDEVHAYDVLEHQGRPGDYRFFFAQWQDFWRIMKPGGVFCGICPAVTSPWLWGDPGHTRTIQVESLVFLDQTEYTAQIGKTAMTDYRRLYRADFEMVHGEIRDGSFFFALRAVKPSRITV